MNPLRRAGEVEFLSQCSENFELANLHTGSISIENELDDNNYCIDDQSRGDIRFMVSCTDVFSHHNGRAQGSYIDC